VKRGSATGSFRTFQPYVFIRCRQLASDFDTAHSSTDKIKTMQVDQLDLLDSALDNFASSTTSCLSLHHRLASRTSIFSVISPGVGSLQELCVARLMEKFRVFRRIMESFRSEETLKIMESKCKPYTAKSTTKPCR